MSLRGALQTVSTEILGKLTVFCDSKPALPRMQPFLQHETHEQITRQIVELDHHFSVVVKFSQSGGKVVSARKLIE